jgi:hypothetical protein
MQPNDPNRRATPDNAIPEPSPGTIKHEPTPERAVPEEEKSRQQDDAVEPQNRKS